MKYERVAAQRQVDWVVFEHRVRELRREFERTGDERILDEIASMKRPHSAAVHGSLTTAAADTMSPSESPPRGERAAAVDEPPSDPSSPAGFRKAEKQEDPPEVQGACREECFIRSTIFMEERSCRLVLSRKWKESLVHPDDDTLAHRRNVAAYHAEVTRREAERELLVKTAAEAEFASTTHRFRVIAAAQNQRAQMKKDFRDARRAVEDEELQERFLFQQHEHEIFSVGLYLRRFNSVLIATRGEEAAHRERIVANEAETFCLVHSAVAALMRLVRLVLQHRAATGSAFNHERVSIIAADHISAINASPHAQCEIDDRDPVDEAPTDTFRLAGRAEALAAANKLSASIQEANAAFFLLSRQQKNTTSLRKTETSEAEEVTM